MRPRLDRFLRRRLRPPRSGIPLSPGRRGEQPEDSPSGLAELQEWLRGKALPALRLRVEPTDLESLSPVESHLGGPPFWPEDEPWPVCGQCDRPLTFVGQVRLDGEGAPRVGRAKLLTFHYCFHCLPCDADEASAYRLRLYDDIDAVRQSQRPRPDADDPDHTRWAPVPCRITFEPVRSVPRWYDAEPELAGLDLGADPWETYLAAARAVAPAPNVESRLGGYPDWVQGSDWPSCPECGRRMHLIWQLDSEPEARIMWGDTGRVYVFACPLSCSEHALALVMQCC